MIDELVLPGAAVRGQVQETGVIAHRPRALSLARCLACVANQSRDADQRPVRPILHGLGNGFENRLVQSRLSNLKLGGVYADGDSARARIQVVARKRSLAPGIVIAVFVEA